MTNATNVMFMRMLLGNVVVKSLFYFFSLDRCDCKLNLPVSQILGRKYVISLYISTHGSQVRIKY